MRAACSVLAALALGCGGNVKLSPGAAEGGAGGSASGGTGGMAPDGGDADVPDSTTDASGEDALSPDDVYGYVCKEGGAPGPGFTTCCNGHVCLGTCEQGACHCGGMAGGCELPSICCNLSEKGPIVCGGPGVCLPQK